MYLAACNPGGNFSLKIEWSINLPHTSLSDVWLILANIIFYPRLWVFFFFLIQDVNPFLPILTPVYENCYSVTRFWKSTIYHPGFRIASILQLTHLKISAITEQDLVIILYILKEIKRHIRTVGGLGVWDITLYFVLIKCM